MAPHPTRHQGLLITLLIGLPLAVLLVWPQAFGAAQLLVMSQLVAFRALVGIGLGALAVVAAVVAWRRRRFGIPAGVAIVLGCSALATGAVLWGRGSDAAPHASIGAATHASTNGGDLTVLAWNTQGGATPPADVARLILDTGADVVSLPEMDDDAAAEVARLVALGGRRMAPDTTYGATGDSWIPTSVLISGELGAYRQDTSAGSTPGLPSAVWRPVDGSGPAIVAAHPAPPLRTLMGEWAAGLRWVATQCNAPDVIVAGDLNATVDHLSGLGAGEGSLIGHCQDAALQAHAGAVGTWPVKLPAWSGAQIDHVLVGSGWTARSVQVVASPAGGTDHRPIVAVLDAR
ncbi:hypothetical protein GCM10009596_00790 [Arthrobacter rhombi]|uniref:endonuclease/exonuclease/phosphatase family protein n=1 Tax=Arthrobacter rhombi TaxID=71253 RepID=UPI0031D2D8F4